MSRISWNPLGIQGLIARIAGEGVGRVVGMRKSARVMDAVATTHIATINLPIFTVDFLINAFARSSLNYTAQQNNFLSTFGFRGIQGVKQCIGNPSSNYGPGIDQRTHVE